MDTATPRGEDTHDAGGDGTAASGHGAGEWLTRQAACDLLGIKMRTWVEWERVGRVPAGSWGRSVNGNKCRVYPADTLRRLKEQHDRQFDPYPDPDQPEVARVPVRSDKHPGMEATVDAADLPLMRGKRWNWSPGHQPGTGTVILLIAGSPKPSLARLLLGLDDPEQLVSHLNGDRLDCRRQNLVVRTRSEVKRASKKVMVKAGKACTSRFKGVTRTESGRKWAATIVVGGKYRNLGRFRSEVDAALAYDAALREVMGDGVVGLNLPDPAKAERLRALEPVIDEDPTWPPPGLVDRHEACAMFGVAIKTWTTWEQRGRITCGRFHPLPNDKPGRCKLYPRDELERARAEIEKLGKPYPAPDRPGVWRVPLKGYLDYREALVDEADLSVVEGRNWNWCPRSEEDGRTEGVVVLATAARQVPLHRLIAGVTDPKVRVAFVNGDALDCRRANLAVRSLAETIQSTRKRATTAGRACASAFKGVSRDADRGLWVVQIRKGGVGLNLGRFEAEGDAAAAYDAAARVLFGPHAHLNLPDQPSTERAMADARAAMDTAANRVRADRRRQRDLERGLRQAAAEPAFATPEEADGDTTIPHETARQLFDVTPTVWRRWHRFGWLPAEVTVDGEPAYALAEVRRLLGRCGVVALPYPDPDRPNCYRVPLSGETGRGREALVDADVVPLIRTRRWRFAAADAGRGGEVQTMIPSENVRLHYVVTGVTADGRTTHVGHRNDDPLDCRRANLVVRTLTDTRANQRKQATFRGRPCTSRFKGVYLDGRSGRWVACIKKDRVKRIIGTYRDEIAAAQAYDEAARDLFGEHARPNFPKGVDAWLEREAA